MHTDIFKLAHCQLCRLAPPPNHALHSLIASIYTHVGDGNIHEGAVIKEETGRRVEKYVWRLRPTSRELDPSKGDITGATHVEVVIVTNNIVRKRLALDDNVVLDVL